MGHYFQYIQYVVINKKNFVFMAVFYGQFVLDLVVSHNDLYLNPDSYLHPQH